MSESNNPALSVQRRHYGYHGESLHRELIPLCQSDRDKILQQKYKGTVRQALLQCHMDRQKRFRSSHQGWRAEYWGTEAQIKGKTAKIQVAPAAGYKIDKIVAYYWHGGENDESRKIKNGSKVALKDLMFIYVYYHPVKTPAYFNIKNMENPKMSPFNYEFHIRVK